MLVRTRAWARERSGGWVSDDGLPVVQRHFPQVVRLASAMPRAGSARPRRLVGRSLAGPAGDLFLL